MISKNNAVVKNTVIACIFMAGTTFTEESPWEPPRQPLQVYMEKIATTTTIDQLNSLLDEAYNEFFSISEDIVPDMYYKARSEIALTKTMMEKNRNAVEIGDFFSTCSLKTLGAVTLLIHEKYDQNLRRLIKQQVDALEEIKKIHEKINQIERSKAYDIANKLKSDLKAIQEEADKKFKELQSSLIQVSNDARGTIISMSDILFETGKADLTADLKTSLAKIAGILLVFKNSRIIIEGHTDNVGSEEYNQTLSEHRAENVMAFLSDQGVTLTRLSAIGYGFSKPVSDNETKEGRAKNRRVDLIVQEKKAE